MSSQSFIFIGRSGSGKGTQAELLVKALQEADPSRATLYIQTGDELRQFIKGNSKTQVLAKNLYDIGGLEPEFIAVYAWVKALVERYTGDEHLIFDGTPRKVHEASVLHSIIEFYGLEKPWVISIKISKEESVKRLISRKRSDDTTEDVNNREKWFETDVAPTIEYYRNNPNYRFIEVDGERSIEEIHQDIVKRIGL